MELFEGLGIAILQGTSAPLNRETREYNGQEAKILDAEGGEG